MTDLEALLTNIEALKRALRNTEQKQYCPHDPFPAQRKFLELNCFEALYGGAAGGGKAISVDTLVLTVDKGFVPMGELVVGDRVFGADGHPTTVLATSDVMYGRPCYRLTFDDGASIIADADHLWQTLTYDERDECMRKTDAFREKRRETRPSRATGKRSAAFTAAITNRNKRMPTKTKLPPVAKLKTTREIFDTQKVREKQNNHSINLAASLVRSNSELLLDPYLLGVWLGDGTTSSGQITSDDDTIVNAFALAGFEVKKYKHQHYSILGLSPYLRRLNVLNNKHVPDIYLTGSIEQRMALLQGLMDTDGYCAADGQVEFCNKNKQLAFAVWHIALTLGLKPTFREGRATLYEKDCGAKYRVFWTSCQPVFRLQKKLDRLKTSIRSVTACRYITDVESVPSVPVRCIQVDAPDGMFLAGTSLIPTHNSDALLMAALQYVHVPYYNALILRKSYSDLALPGAIMDRSHAWLRGTDASWHGLDRQWRFPSGAKIQFGYLDNENDKYRYQSANFHGIFFDELTQFPESRYSYILSRCRRNADETIPLRIRSASNPGGVGHDWVWRRFVAPDKLADRVFVPAGLGDNPHLDQVSYRKALESLDSVTRRQLLDGEWIQDTSGLVYRFEGTRNQYEVLPAGKYTYIIGIDFGINDKTAFCVIGWREFDKTIYVVESFGDSGIIPSEAAKIVQDLMRKYSPERIVGDTGGMGKAFTEEMRRRYGIPIMPTDKQNKLGYISLLNGMLEEGKLKASKHLAKPLIDEWSTLIWHESRQKEHPAFDNHFADACLYSVRAAYAYLEEAEPSPLPAWGSEDAYRQKEREIEQAAELRYEQQRQEIEW